MKGGDLQRPTRDLVEHFYARFDSDPRYGVADNAIIKLIGQFPLNSSLEDVLLKVCTINSLYSTQIYATMAVAEHIQQLNIDRRLADGDATLVSEIGHVDVGGKRKYFYSFATKYCSWHNQEAYAIYDTYVADLLVRLNRQFQFSDFTRADLRLYPRYMQTISDFRNFFDLEGIGLKRLDKFLWIYGKDLKGT